MNRKHKLFTCFLIIILISCKTQKSPQENNNIIKGKTGIILDSLLTPYVNELRYLTDNNAGLAVGITKGNEIIYAKTFGYANIEKNIKANFNTVFHIASISKPFTAVAITKLIQQGKIKLEDQIIDYIPEFKMQGDGYDLITIKHILTHTSGIPRHISKNDWLNPVYGSKALEENLKFVKDFQLEFTPGSKFSYSNSAFDILGIVVERASEMTFADYLKENILYPVSMMQSEYYKPMDSLPSNWAVPYSYGLETQEWQPYPYAEKVFPSSGLQTTILDLCNWGMFHLNKGKHKDYQIINEDLFNLLITPSFDTPWGDKIGLSWFLQSYLEKPIIMHTGTDTGFESIMYIYPEDDISIIVIANRDFARTGRIINAASEILFSREPKNYSVSAKYKFAQSFNKQGIEKAKELWQEMKMDTTDIYYSNNEDILTTGAVLENGKRWTETKEVLEFYLTLDEQSTYAWRLLGNANLNLGDTLSALSCYSQCLKINPDYEKAKIAIEEISRK